jgi:lysophospholipase L1-like esterase
MAAPTIPTQQLLTFRKKALFTTVMLFLVLFIPLAILELYVRISHPYTDLWVVTGRRNGPNPIAPWAFVDAFSAYRARPVEGKRSVNSYGFIATPELTVAKPQDTIRIAFLGGSSTAGTGRSDFADQHTWPWQVAEMLRKGFREKNIEFINGALGGYTSFESYGRLWSRIRFFSPDIIIIYHGWNEMYYFTDADRVVSWRTHSDGSWGLDRAEKPIAIYEPLLIDYFIWPSQLLIRFRLHFTKALDEEKGSESPSQLLSDQYDQRALEIWRTNLRLFRETAQILGAQLFVAKQATLIVPDLPLEQQSRCRYGLHGFDHMAHVDAFQRIYRIIDEEIAKDRVIDLTPLSGRSEYFHDHIHPTIEGAQQIAKVVSNVLLAHLDPSHPKMQ